jgi:hypothetical protein
MRFGEILFSIQSFKSVKKLESGCNYLTLYL